MGRQGGSLATAAYRLDGGQITFTHTIVPPDLEGQGVGSRLIAGVLDQVRARGLKVVPQCILVEHYIGGRPELRDLLA